VGISVTRVNANEDSFFSILPGPSKGEERDSDKTTEEDEDDIPLAEMAKKNKN